MESIAWLAYFFCPIMVLVAFFAGVTMERGQWPWKRRR